MVRDYDPGGASQEPGNRSKGAPHGAPFPLGDRFRADAPIRSPPRARSTTASPKSPAPEKPRRPLDAMRRQLEHHSALKDLGPLFGPKALGQGPARDGPGRDPC